MLRLPWTELAFDLVAEGPWLPPDFAGSMHRGALAAALRRLVCVMHRAECEGCPLVMACLYPRLFETRPDPAAGVMRRYARAPHPLLVVARLRTEACRDGDGAPPVERLTVRLFGAEVASAPFVIRAVEEMALRGLGRGRTPFRLARLWAGAVADARAGVADDPSRSPAAASGVPATMPPPPRLPARRRWHLASPLRLMAGGRPVDAAAITGPTVGRAILRRVGLMAQFYGTLDPGVDFGALAEEAGRVRLEAADLRWTPLRRWSSRQGASQSIGGLTGSLVLDFAAAPRIAELADWVPVVHLGKETALGLGHVVAEAA